MASRRRFFRPRWVGALQGSLARHIRLDPLVFSVTKLVVVTPLLLGALEPFALLPNDRRLVSALLVAFFLLDYVEAAVARERKQEPRWARVFDRFTDYPLLLVVIAVSAGVVPDGVLVGKAVLDLLLLVLFVAGRGGVEQNRLRTGIGYAALVALLLISQGWGGRVLTPMVVEYLLWANIAFSAITAAFYLGLLQKRFVADALSGANLLCGVFSMVFAARGRFEISLLFVILGTAFDGFDGAAARRWGGTGFGVYSDDLADGVNYGIAPGVALYFVLGGGLSGWIVGIFYPAFTILRLVFFTLNKAEGDPNYFAGVPSPVGGLIAMSSIVVFEDEPAALGLMVGIAVAQMVSFSTHYRHLGRALTKYRRALVGAPLYLVVLLLGLRLWGAKGAATVILLGNLVYGFLPTVLAFMRVISVRRAARPSGLDEERVREDVEAPRPAATISETAP